MSGINYLQHSSNTPGYCYYIFMAPLEEAYETYIPFLMLYSAIHPRSFTDNLYILPYSTPSISMSVEEKKRLVDFDGPDDPLSPLNWSSKKKYV